MLGSLSMLLPPCPGADTEQLVVPRDACQSYSVDRDMCPPGREHIVLGLHVLPIVHRTLPERGEQVGSQLIDDDVCISSV